jgi:hypothetical protein
VPEEPEVVRDDVYSGGVGAISDTDPFVIDQTVTVAWDDQPRPWVQALLAELGETLAAHGGTAAILRDHAPESLADRDYADAFVVSTENTPQLAFSASARGAGCSAQP